MRPRWWALALGAMILTLVLGVAYFQWSYYFGLPSWTAVMVYHERALLISGLAFVQTPRLLMGLAVIGAFVKRWRAPLLFFAFVSLVGMLSYPFVDIMIRQVPQPHPFPPFDTFTAYPARIPFFGALNYGVLSVMMLRARAALSLRVAAATVFGLLAAASVAATLYLKVATPLSIAGAVVYAFSIVALAVWFANRWGYDPIEHVDVQPSIA